MDRSLQPWLHELEVSVHGNLSALVDRSGDMGIAGSGLFADDRRVVSRASLTCDGVRPTRVSSGSVGPHTEVVAAARNLGDDVPDPTVEVRRVRALRDGGLDERVTLTSRASAAVRTVVSLTLAGDGADLADVKGGAPGGALLPATATTGGVAWADARHATEVHCSPGTITAEPGGGCRVAWPVTLAPGESAVLELRVDVRRIASTVFDADPATDRLDWSLVRVRAQDTRLDLTVESSLADLAGLLLADPEDPADVFAAAGSPWFLTLFGRDSLWTARLTLPFGTDLARGTLRTLARRQGAATDPSTGEEPGKILHEVRRSTYADPSSHLHLPPVYFGTVDATSLWVCLLHDAWRWGLADAEVTALAPHLERALAWQAASVERSPDGFLRYVDESGSGLANQGWKDSGDSMRRRDGSIAEAPIALVETQAYAVQAARGAAHLREEVLGRPGDDLRRWAEELSDRVRASFWVSDADGPYLAMALDRHGAPVDGVGSNMGHVLGTGLLTAEEGALVAGRLTSPDLLGPYGIGTLGRGNPAFNPVGYHTGSVWSHDTAIGALGLAIDGHGAESASVLRALVDVASRFSYRLPELFGGEPGTTGPVPYPASCRPQAWAAAAAGALVSASLGLSADAATRCLQVAPLRPAPFGALSVSGLRVAGHPVSVTTAPDGSVTDVDVPPGWTVSSSRA